MNIFIIAYMFTFGVQVRCRTVFNNDKWDIAPLCPAMVKEGQQGEKNIKNLTA